MAKSMKFRLQALPCFSLLYVLAGCNPSTSNQFDYGTKIDSARFYFFKGWEEIMDNGRWTESEMAFRKAVEFDPNWVLGKSLVGRISRNPEEKKQLLGDIQLNMEFLGPIERSLVEVNMLSIAASVNRDLGIPNTPEFNEQRRQTAEMNFGNFARQFPEDDYFKAEYIEFLHANHSAQLALDSIELLTTPRQKDLPFFISYTASMHLELGEIEKAKTSLEKLKSILADPSYLSVYALESQILESEGKLIEARDLINNVVAADSNHLIARGMKVRIESALKDK